jgi:hypothetical protein
MKLALCLALLVVGACGPAYRTSGYQARNVSPGSCQVTVIRNGDNTLHHPKLGSIVFRGSPLRGMCSELDVMRRMQDEACAAGATLVNVHTVKQPDFMISGCFYATGDFYAEASGFEPSPRPIVELPAAPASSVEVDVGVKLAGVLGGNQKDVPLEPAPDSLSTVSLGLAGRYFRGRLGGELELDPLHSTHTSKQGYESLTLYTGQVLRAGGIAQLVRHPYIGGAVRLDLGAGANHTWLRAGDGLKKVAAGAGTPLRDDAATGFGYYAHLDFRLQSDSGFLSTVGLKYEHENPKFPGAQEPIDGHSLEFRLHAGWLF